MKNKRIWFQIAAWVVCFALAYRLFSFVQADQVRKEERYAELQLKAAELEETDDQQLDVQTEVYDKLCSQLETPVFICWGDSAMAGNREDSLPSALNRVIDQNLFSPLSRTFSRVLENKDHELPSVTVNNMGVGNEGMRQILVRAGVNTMDLGESIEIYAEAEPVTVKLMDEEAWNSEEKDDELKFAKQRDISFGKVRISGIEGSLITTDDWFDSSHPRYAFIRDEDGNRQWIGSRTEVEIETATQFLGQIPVFFFENDSGRSTEGLASDIERLVQRYADTETEDDPDADGSSGGFGGGQEDDSGEEPADQSSYELPFVVICTTKEGSDLDKELVRRFGDRYIRNDKYSNDMTGSSYRVLAQEVYDNLNEQGCFVTVQGKIALAVEEADSY